MNNEIYYNAAFSGFLRGVYAGRVVAQWASMSRTDVVAYAETFAQEVDSLIAFDSEVTTSSSNPAQLTIGSSQDIAREQWKGNLLEALCFASISQSFPQSMVGSYYAETAGSIVDGWNSAIAGLVASYVAPPPPPSTEFVVDNAPFTYASASPTLLLSINPGDIICTGAAIVITQSWLNSNVRIQLGTPATPNLFLDINPAVEGQYSTPQVEEFSASDQLILTITGSDTQGAGYVVFSYNR